MNEYCVHLDWSGWPPEVWAAWAQAILSAAAIFFAYRLSNRQDRLAMSRKANACVALITYAHDELVEIRQNPLSRPSLTRASDLASRFSSANLESIPVFELLVPIVRLGSSLTTLSVELDNTSRAAGSPEGKEIAAVRDVDAAMTVAQECYAEAIEAANPLNHQTHHQRRLANKLKAGTA